MQEDFRKRNSMVIIDQFRAMTEQNRVKFREEVLKATGMKTSTFYSKMAGSQAFRLPEICVIRPILKKYEKKRNEEN